MIRGLTLRWSAMALGGAAGLVFGPLQEFLSYYVRLSDLAIQALATSALVAAWYLAKLADRQLPGRRLALLIAMLPLVLAFVHPGGPAGVGWLWQTAMAGAAIALLAVAGGRLEPAARPVALRWGIAGGILFSWIHPALALALGGSDGWWMAAMAMAAVIVALGSSRLPAQDAPVAEQGPPALAIGGLAMLLYLLPAWFDYAIGAATAAPLGTVALLVGMMIGTALHRVPIAGYAGAAGVALLIVPMGAAAVAQLALLIVGVGSGVLLSRPAPASVSPMLAAAVGVGTSTAICAILLSGDAIGVAGQWALTVATGLIPAMLLAASAHRTA